MGFKVRENKVRRQATRLGFMLQKSRAKKWSLNNHMGYRLVDFNNYIVLGEKYDANLDEIIAYLKGYAESI